MKVFLATYNTLYATSPLVFNTIGNLTKISQAPVQFLAFQEVRNTHIYTDIIKQFRNNLPGFDLRYYIHDRPSRDHLGLATCSSQKILRYEKVLFPRIKRTPLNPQFYFMREMPLCGAVIVYIQIGKKIIRVTNLHLDVFGGIIHKIRQLTEVKKRLQSTSVDVDFVCGDFNTIGPVRLVNKKIYRQRNYISEFLGNGYNVVEIKGHKPFTCDATQILNPAIPLHKPIELVMKRIGIRFRQRLDWIFYKHARCIQSGIEYEAKGSDHYPLWGEFQI